LHEKKCTERRCCRRRFKKKIDWARDVISVALGELGVPTLEDVYNMSWAEFRIRLFAFKRMQRDKLELLRIHAYHTASGGTYAFSPKEFPKTIDKFWKLDKKVDKKAQKMRLEILKKAKEEYNKKVSKRNGKA
jgi:hypothetical protein